MRWIRSKKVLDFDKLMYFSCRIDFDSFFSFSFDAFV